MSQSRPLSFRLYADASFFRPANFATNILTSYRNSKGIAINILSADIRRLNGKPYGQMLIEMPEDAVTCQTVKDYLTAQGITVKEVRNV